MQDRKKKQVAMFIYRPAEPATFRVNALFQSSINNQLKQENIIIDIQLAAGVNISRRLLNHLKLDMHYSERERERSRGNVTYCTVLYLLSVLMLMENCATV